MNSNLLLMVRDEKSDWFEARIWNEWSFNNLLVVFLGKGGDGLEEGG